MDSVQEVVVPTFVNAHLFWIIDKKDLLLRAAMEKVMRSNRCNKIKGLGEVSNDQIVAVNVEGVWTRAIVKDVEKDFGSDFKYKCWLPDYGTMRVVNNLFHLPEGLEECPHLARQASLENVVNLMTDLVLGDSGYEFQFKTTTDNIEGVQRVALDCLEAAEKLFFEAKRQDEFNSYGDITCVYQENAKESLTEYLIDKKLIRIDEALFKTLEPSRTTFKENYFQHIVNVQQPLVKTERNLNRIIFNQNEGVSMNFFKRNFAPDEDSSDW